MTLSKLSTKLYSEVLSEPYLSERGWSALNDYLNPRIGVLDFLVASKAISPQLYTINAEESVQAMLRNAESLGAERLLTPLRNWLVFEKQIGWILAQSSGGMANSVITLGGEDERKLWTRFTVAARTTCPRRSGTFICARCLCPAIGRHGKNGHWPRYGPVHADRYLSTGPAAVPGRGGLLARPA